MTNPNRNILTMMFRPLWFFFYSICIDITPGGKFIHFPALNVVDLKRKEKFQSGLVLKRK